MTEDARRVLFDHLTAEVTRTGTDAVVILGGPAKLEEPNRTIRIYVDCQGDENGSVYAWRTNDVTEGSLPNKLICEMRAGAMIEPDWPSRADAMVAELQSVQRRRIAMTELGLDPKRPPASWLTVHRIVHDMLRHDGRGMLRDPNLIFRGNGYIMPGLIEDIPDDTVMGEMFVIDLQPMAGRMIANMVGRRDYNRFSFEEIDGRCMVTTYVRSVIPDTLLQGMAGCDLADVIGHAAIIPGRYQVISADLLKDRKDMVLVVRIEDQQVPLVEV